MTADFNDTFRSRPRTGVLILVLIASFILPAIPVLNLISLPLSTFTTTVHEMGHAIACLLTGGTVTGMTVVSDGEGHGGLTFCVGGNPFIYTQAGYLGTALFGSLLIWLGRYPRLSRLILIAVGGSFIFGGGMFMVRTIAGGQALAGIASLIVATALGSALIWAAAKTNYYWANLLLLFLGVQTGLNAIIDDRTLFLQAVGAIPGSWSDASNMAHMTGYPAALWALMWTIAAILMLTGTFYCSYKLDKQRS
jgi:hypothetical protein